MKKIVMVLIGVCIGVCTQAAVELGHRIPDDVKIISVKEIDHITKEYTLEDGGKVLTVRTKINHVVRIIRSTDFKTEGEALRKFITLAEALRDMDVRLRYTNMGGTLQYAVGQQTDIYGMVIRIIFTGKAWAVQWVNWNPMTDK